MIELNKKLEVFQSLVYSREKEHYKELLDKKVQENQETIASHKSDLEKEYAKKLRQRIDKAHDKALQNVREQSQVIEEELRQLEKDIFNEVMDALRKKLTAYTLTDEYKEHLTDGIKKMDLQNMTLAVLEKDKAYVEPFIKDSIEILKPRFIGGFILKAKDGSFLEDYTYESKLEEKSYAIGKTIHDFLKEE